MPWTLSCHMSVAPGNQNSTKNSVLPNSTSQSERNKCLKTIIVRIKTFIKWRPKTVVWKCQQCQQL
jgi:hypothetical protein